MFPFDHKYPGTDLHEIDLAYILGQIKDLRTDMQEFVTLNTVSYADPIGWNIESQYAEAKIVKDPVSGVLYISKQPVPSGIALTNTDYWLEVGNFSYQVSFLKDAICANDEGTAPTASRAYDAGAYLWWNDELYKTTAAIAEGGTLAGNIERITIVEELAAGTQEEIDALDLRVTDLEGTAEDLLADVEKLKNLPTNYLNPFRYYIDGTNGSDENDGLSEATAFKTIEHFFSLLNGNSGDIRANIIRAGTYTYTKRQFNGISIHLTGTVPGVVIQGPENNLAIYNCHFNIENITWIHNGTSCHSDNSLLSLTNGTVIDWGKQMMLYNGALYADHVTFRSMVFINSAAAEFDACNFACMDSSLFYLQLRRASNAVVNEECTFAQREDADGTGGYLFLNGSRAFVQCAPPAMINPPQRGIVARGSILHITANRLAAFENQSGGNDLAYQTLVINSQSVTL